MSNTANTTPNAAECIKFYENCTKRETEWAIGEVRQLRERLQSMIRDLDVFENRIAGKLGVAEGYTLTAKDKANMARLTASSIFSSADALLRSAASAGERAASAEKVAELLASFKSAIANA